MFKAIIILSLFIGTNGSYLGTNCHLNETQPDLVFEKCEKIRVTDLTTSCPIYIHVEFATFVNGKSRVIHLAKIYH